MKAQRIQSKLQSLVFPNKITNFDSCCLYIEFEYCGLKIKLYYFSNK